MNSRRFMSDMGFLPPPPCLEIADKATPENVSVARLQVDTRKWAAARLAPKKYSDRVEHDHKGGLNFQPAVLVQIGGNERGDVSIEADEMGGKLITSTKQ